MKWIGLSIIGALLAVLGIARGIIHHFSEQEGARKNPENKEENIYVFED